MLDKESYAELDCNDDEIDGASVGRAGRLTCRRTILRYKYWRGFGSLPGRYREGVILVGCGEERYGEGDTSHKEFSPRR